MHLRWLLARTGASRLSDLTLDAVERALASLRLEDRSARTVNHRRASALAFVNWCVKTGRLEANPIGRLGKLDESRDRRRIRRALTDEELTRLMAVAEARGRKAWYLLAVLAGLRRSDLVRLTWGSVDLEAAVLTIRDGKAKREDRLPIHSEALEELRRLRPVTVLPGARVFPTAVTNRTRQEDFKRAKIPLAPDEQGRVVDLHALRGTLGTRIARQGIAPQVAQQLMRHADYRTTLKHYTMLGLSDACGRDGVPARDRCLAGARAGHRNGGRRLCRAPADSPALAARNSARARERARAELRLRAVTKRLQRLGRHGVARRRASRCERTRRRARLDSNQGPSD